MHPDWQDYLSHQGATIDGGRVRDFGDPAGELAAAAGSGILADLSRYGLLAYEGEDAAGFLHGQFTNDVKALPLDACQHGGYCTAKGRMLASFLMWRTDTGYRVQLPAELVEPIRKRLAMFILRAKVSGADVGERYARLGVAGHGAEAALKACVAAVPEAPFGVCHFGDLAVLRLDAARFELVVPMAQAPRYWEALARQLKPVGGPAWEWLEIRAGIASVRPATAEQLVPQMANLELIGGLSFKKGCYPGQEIVARTQYLGKQKRRMYLARIDAAEPPAEGDPLYGADFGGQSSGLVVNTQPAPDGGYELLAVVHSTSVEAGVRHKAPDGPPLSFLPLPYGV